MTGWYLGFGLSYNFSDSSLHKNLRDLVEMKGSEDVKT